MISPDPYNELKFLGLLFISYILYQIGKFLSNSEMVHVQVSKAVQHLVGMTADALFLKKKMLSLPRYTMPKNVVQWSKAKMNSIFLAAIMEKRFHQLSFYLIKISQVLTELLIWTVFCSSDILMSKLGALPPAKAGGVWYVSIQIYYITYIVTMPE